MKLLSVLALVALPFMAVSAEDVTSVSTYTSTRTVYRVYTETVAGSPTSTARSATTTGAGKGAAQTPGSLIGAGSSLQANGVAVAAIGAAAAFLAL